MHPERIFKGLIEMGLRIELVHFGLVEDLETFREKWCFEVAICYTDKGQLVFNLKPFI